MDLEPASLIASFVIGSIGLVAFVYGKRQSRVPQMVVGLVLLVFPYFVSNAIVMSAIAIALLGAMWLAVRMGW